MNARGTYDQWIRRLRNQLQQPLPGFEAQRPMVPQPRSTRVPRSERHRIREAAVVAVLYPDDREVTRWEPWLVLTRRTDRVAHHKGQICLPGGALDPGESPLDAARREVHEELGLAPDQLDVLGSLTPVYVPVSGFEVQPFVACLSAPPDLTPQPDEVAGLVRVPVRELLDRELHDERTETFEGVPVRIPFFRTQGHEVWGATAMMLSELCVLIEACEDPTAGD